MRTIVHISDLHFGTEEPALAAAVLRVLSELQPHLVVVTGDLTQRARREQFVAARQFLDAISAPKMVVPGNHDIPLYNVAARFGWPLASYRRWIIDSLEPVFDDDELAVAGVNTARSNTWKDGRVSVADIERLRRYFESRMGLFKILASHHPFIPTDREPTSALVGRAESALQMLADCQCHVILAGHLHQGYAGDVKSHHIETERSILVVQAGTAISRRRRGEPNAFNVITVDRERLQLDVRSWTGTTFASASVTDFDYLDGRWSIGRPVEKTA